MEIQQIININLKHKTETNNLFTITINQSPKGVKKLNHEKKYFFYTVAGHYVFHSTSIICPGSK